MNMLFDFTVDKETNSIHITREFAADQDLVWDAFTKPEILEQWYAPKPYRLQTKEMDFRVGGRWLYTMVSTEPPTRYSLAEYIDIQPKSGFTTKNSFSDENGNPINGVFTSSITTTSFTAGAGKTTVNIVKKMASLAQLEQFAASGFIEGTAVGYRNLDEYLLTLGAQK